MGSIKKFRRKKKHEMLSVSEKEEASEEENGELAHRLMLLEYRFGYFSLKGLEADLRMKKTALKAARKRLKNGLMYRV